MRRSLAGLVLASAFLFFFICAAPAGQAADFPTKGRIVNVIVPFPPGGATDIGTRMVVEGMKDELGVVMQVMNKPGASSQVGTTELVRSKPDGYTMAATPLPAVILTYLDPDRQAVYTGKNIQPVANIIIPPVVFSVRSDSPYKTLQELLDASKAKPGTIKIGTAGVMSNNHLTILKFQKVSGAQFALVHFDGGLAGVNALLGGHIDVTVSVLPEMLTHYRSGAIRALGVTDRHESKFLPGVKPLEAMGWRVYAYGSSGLGVPAGTPKPIVDTLSRAAKKAMEDESFRKKMEDMGYPVQYMNAEEYAKFWTETEADVAPLVKEAKAEQAAKQ